MVKVLCVEDETAIADTVVYALETEGFQVRRAQLGAEALQALKVESDFSLVILDVGLPDINGFDVCKQIRLFSDIPIIFLTARNEEVDRIVGLEIGADDYVSKPFSPRELAARVKVILKRSQVQPVVQDNNDCEFVIDEHRAQVLYYGQPLTLTRYEYLILKYMLAQPERVFNREQIMTAVWSEPEASLDRVVDTHIKTLRSKLREIREDVNPIRTHRGLGYSISGRVRES